LFERMAAPSVALSEPGAADSAIPRAERLAVMAADNFQFIWRSLRRLGVAPPMVDDAAQQVFEVASRRLSEIELGRERAFLFKTAIFVAAEARRAAARRRSHDAGEVLDQVLDGRPNPEEASDWAKKRALLDAVLDAMAEDTRSVFVLFELEELPLAEIAELLEVPRGTVASRLRRAREEFQAEVKRLRARLEFVGAVR
jgi:RNA polymerase sigma-70 factor (ECF subfamily)